ncbi:response regulator [Paenarthrobacter sp. NPDC058040]|uniref:response regulator n=1 Tax=unclassified Paenarthrobacter TaxID=2634190 RepID=UPI0036DADF63
MNEAPARRTCLIVEDDHDIGQLIESILIKEGFHTRLHTTGSAALREMETLQPDLITLDAGLPDIDGRGAVGPASFARFASLLAYRRRRKAGRCSTPWLVMP